MFSLPAHAGHDSALRALERTLGDPLTPGRPLSYRDTVQYEEQGGMPPGVDTVLRGLGLYEHMVPRKLGGKFVSIERFCGLSRALARRNLTPAVMLGSTLLASLPVWLWGNQAQRRALARGVMAGEAACFAVSEPEHGSDLQATETVARPDETGLRLTGTKWPVGNATRSRFVTTLVRMGDGHRHALLLVDKQQLPAGSWRALPPAKTSGLRGHDLSGIAFDDAPVPASAVIGRPGAGLAQVLKTLQITRCGVGSLSLGTMDAAARIGLHYSQERVLYGQTIYQLPIIRDQLLEAHLDILIGECLQFPVLRAVSVHPARLSMWSAVVKYLLPVMAERQLAGIRAVLGARSYLREGVAEGVFQKLERDHAIASIFDGTTHVNLYTIAAQLPQVVGRARPPGDRPRRWGVLENLFSLTAPMPSWEPEQAALAVANAGHDEITQCWEELDARIQRLVKHGRDGVVPPALIDFMTELGRIRSETYRAVSPDRSFECRSVEAQRVAADHCVLQAATSCILVWLINREALGGPFAEGHWLLACLAHLLRSLRKQVRLAGNHLRSVEESVLAAADRSALFHLRSL